MEKCGNKEGWLVVFDRNADKTWEEKLFMYSETYKDKTITVLGA